MKTRIAVLLFAVAVAATAQSSNGYIFFAPGGVTSSGHTSGTIHAGGGLDAVLYKGAGLNLELGALAPRDCLSCTVGLFSAGGVYYFLHSKNSRIAPFVDGGYSLMFRTGHLNLGYFGGGVNLWPVHHVGLRLEMRDHVNASFGTIHYWGFRIGLALR